MFVERPNSCNLTRLYKYSHISLPPPLFLSRHYDLPQYDLLARRCSLGCRRSAYSFSSRSTFNSHPPSPPPSSFKSSSWILFMHTLLKPPNNMLPPPLDTFLNNIRAPVHGQRRVALPRNFYSIFGCPANKGSINLSSREWGMWPGANYPLKHFKHCTSFMSNIQLEPGNGLQLRCVSGMSGESIYGNCSLPRSIPFMYPGQYPFIFSIIHLDTLTRLIYSNDLRDGETMVVRNPKPPAHLRI
ncbi:hypothetical protein C8R43DRAFT_1141889 [Mycena crocata]|nr:hypothetical protein C8R43DRAFT_1141889 [Mycena crocata]